MAPVADWKVLTKLTKGKYSGHKYFLKLTILYVNLKQSLHALPQSVQKYLYMTLYEDHNRHSSFVRNYSTDLRSIDFNGKLFVIIYVLISDKG